MSRRIQSCARVDLSLSLLAQFVQPCFRLSSQFFFLPVPTATSEIVGVLCVLFSASRVKSNLTSVVVLLRFFFSASHLLCLVGVGRLSFARLCEPGWGPRVLLLNAMALCDTALFFRLSVRRAQNSVFTCSAHSWDGVNYVIWVDGRVDQTTAKRLVLISRP